jgi:hypothetical protein
MPVLTVITAEENSNANVWKKNLLEFCMKEIVF